MSFLFPQRESLARDVEYERGARREMESRLEEASKEADTSRARLHALHANINRYYPLLFTINSFKVVGSSPRNLQLTQFSSVKEHLPPTNEVRVLHYQTKRSRSLIQHYSSMTKPTKDYCSLSNRLRFKV